MMWVMVMENIRIGSNVLILSILFGLAGLRPWKGLRLFI
jgi:hypothetical protein